MNIVLIDEDFDVDVAGLRERPVTLPEAEVYNIRWTATAEVAGVGSVEQAIQCRTTSRALAERQVTDLLLAGNYLDEVECIRVPGGRSRI